MTDELRRQCEEILAASEKATSGPWRADALNLWASETDVPASDAHDYVWHDWMDQATTLTYGELRSTEDADLIALLRNLAPALAEHTLRLLDVYEAAERVRQRHLAVTKYGGVLEPMPELWRALASFRAGHDTEITDCPECGAPVGYPPAGPCDWAGHDTAERTRA